MNIINKLTLRHMLLNRKRTIITLLGIILSVSMITAISGFVVSFQDIFRREAISTGGNWHVSYRGISKETAEEIGADLYFSDLYLQQEEEDSYTVYLLVKKLRQDVFEKAEAIGQEFGIPREDINLHTELLRAEGFFEQQNYYDAIYSFAGVLLVLVMIGSVLVIGNAFYISSSERGRQFGMLISVGATRKQIRNSILFEGIALAGAAIPLGILFGFAVEFIALEIANNLLDGILIGYPKFRVVCSAMAIFISVAVAFMTVLLSAWFPAGKASKMSAVEAIRQTKDIKIKPNKVKVNLLTKMVFGFEGMLAVKALKRNSNKYRATVISLVVSIVLFIGVSGFGQMLQQASDMLFEDHEISIFIRLLGDNMDLQDEAAEKLAAIESVPISRARIMNYKTSIEPDMFTKQAQKYFEAGETGACLISVGKEEFQSICKDLNVEPESYLYGNKIKGILINTTGTFNHKAKKTTIVPYDIKPGTEISVSSGAPGEKFTIDIDGSIDKIPKGALADFNYKNLNIIVSEDVIKNLATKESSPSLNLMINSEHADVYMEKAKEVLRDSFISYSLQNLESSARQNHNLNLLVMVFIYGFIAMLSLIGITSVIGTISTGIALRTQEFAMLQSVGMTKEGLSRMLNLESLFYGLKALSIGLPLGAAVTYLLYRALDKALEFPYIWPVNSMCISVIAVMLLTFSTMHYARAKQKSKNIVDSLRGENI